MTLLLLGCAIEGPPATVSVEGFGEVGSALLRPAFSGEGVIYNDGALVLGARVVRHSAIDITTWPGGCEAMQERERRWREASALLLDGSDGGADQDAFCAGMPTYLEDSDWGGANVLSLICAEPGCEVADLEPGAHPVTEEDELYGRLFLRRDWEGYGWDEEACRVDLRDPAPGLEVLGDLRLDSMESALLGGFEGETEESEAVVSEFAAESCEIDLSGVLFILH